MKNTLKLSFLALLLAFYNCKNDPKQEDPSTSTGNVKITHTLGTIEVPSNPKNVVALDFGSLEILNELGIKIIGLPKANVPQHLEKFKNDESIADLGSLKEINFEKLNELNPDVIFMSGRLQDVYPELSKIAPTFYLETDNKDFMNSIKKNSAFFGEIFNKNEEVNQAVNKIENRIAEVQEKTKDSEKEALIVLYNNGKFSAYGKGSRFGFIHDVLGLKESVEGLEVARHGQAVSNEFIQEANPDYLFIIDRSAVIDKKATNKSEIENKLIQQTKAYKNGKIIYLNPEVWYLSGNGLTSINMMIDDVANNL